MAKKRRRKFRGIAEPVHVREPLFIRLCAAFVDNLTLILRTALIVGALVLVHDLRTLLDEPAQSVAESAPAPPPVPYDSAAAKPQDPVLSDRVLHALNCTYEDYRNAHFDECVKDRSRIYLRPHADPDDTGHVIYDTPVLYARLDDYTSVE